MSDTAGMFRHHAAPDQRPLHEQLKALGVDPLLLAEDVGEDVDAIRAAMSGTGGADPIVEDVNKVVDTPATPATPAKPATVVEQRTALRRRQLKESERAKLGSVLAEASGSAEAAETIEEALSLAGDIAELMANRYRELGEADLGDKLIVLADAADALAESDEEKAIKEARASKMVTALLEATRQYEATMDDKAKDDDDEGDGEDGKKDDDEPQVKERKKTAEARRGK